MSRVLVSTKGQIVLPAVRKALGLKPGMRVDIRVEGKGARIAPAPVKSAAKLSDIQAIFKHTGSRVAVKDMRVTGYEDCHLWPRALAARGPGRLDGSSGDRDLTTRRLGGAAAVKRAIFLRR